MICYKSDLSKKIASIVPIFALTLEFIKPTLRRLP